MLQMCPTGADKVKVLKDMIFPLVSNCHDLVLFGFAAMHQQQPHIMGVLNFRELVFGPPWVDALSTSADFTV
jgi:hypothetical protein